MNKRNITLLLAAACLSMSAQYKINPQGALLLDSYKALKSQTAGSRALDAKYVIPNPEAATVHTVGALVVMNDGCSVSDLEKAGATVQSVRNGVAMVTVSLDDMERLSELAGVRSIQFGKMSEPMLNKARSITNTTDVQAGTGLSMAYDGTGVVTGLYDKGLDPNHVNFAGRVQRVWKVTGSGMDPDVIEYATPERIQSFTTDNSADTHGTHVLGIMSGSYNGSGIYATYTVSGNVTVNSRADNKNPYYGVATGADIAIGCGDFYDYAILKGCERIVEYAKAEGKPAVVNLSLGSPVGPHDGSTAENKYLAGLGEEAIICISAGNEGQDAVSFQKTFSSDTDEFKTLLTGEGLAYASAVDVWGKDATEFTPAFVIFDTTTKEIIYRYNFDENTGGKYVYITEDSYNAPGYIHDDVFNSSFGGYIIAFTNLNPNNNRYEFYMQTNLTARNSRYVPGIVINGSAGVSLLGTTNDAFTSRGFEGWTNGNAEASINDMACGDNVIAVGSFNSRNAVARMNATQSILQGSAYSVGAISPFSSYGTTLQGKNLPVICGPGCTLVSSISTYNASVQGITGSTSAYAKQMTAWASSKVGTKTRDNYWTNMSGTSMSSPYVSGTCALMLQADNTLGVDQVREYLVKTADKPADPNNIQWGAGSLNTFEAVKMAAGNSVAIGKVFDDEEQRLMLQVNPGSIDIYVAGETAVEAKVFAVTGALVAEARAEGSEVTVSTDGLAKGVYVLNVNGRYSKKVVVR